MTEKQERGRGSLFHRIKLVGIAIAALLTLIVVLQNTESVQTDILFVSITMPRAVLLFGTLVIGFLIGLLATLRRK